MDLSQASAPNLARAVQRHFPLLHTQDLLEKLSSHSTPMDLPPDTTILEVGSYISVIPLVLKGAVKVMREHSDGNEYYLYHILPGQSCAMTIKNSIDGKKSSVHAVTVESTRLVAVPSDFFKQWIRHYPGLFNFVLQTYHIRFDEMLMALDSVAFRKLDQQLSRLLRERSKAVNSKTLEVTHQGLSEELNTSREVVSRLLKHLEQQSKIRLSRNSVEILENL